MTSQPSGFSLDVEEGSFWVAIREWLGRVRTGEA